MSPPPARDGIELSSMGFMAGFARPMGHLPRAVGMLFDAASRAGFRVREGKQQVMLFSGAGAKIGGWNKVNAHWYVSAVIAEGREALMRRHGFGLKGSTANRHRWWQLDGADGADGFRRVCESLTGDRIGAV